MKYTKNIISESIHLCKAFVCTAEYEMQNPRIIDMKIQIAIPKDEDSKKQLFDKLNKLIGDPKFCRVNLFMTTEDSIINKGE